MSIFSKIKVPRIRKSSFNLNYTNRLSCDFGQLVPFYLEKVNPGEVFKHQHRMNSNLSAIVGQLSQEFDIRTEYFFIPSRLLWENFNDFLVGGKDGQTEYVHPYIDLKDFSEITAPAGSGNDVLAGTILDYLGYKTLLKASGQTAYTNGLKVDALPLYAYLKLWCDYYGDENLNDVEFSPAPDGDCQLDFAVRWQNMNNLVYNVGDPQANLLRPFYRNYRKDYFTGALPFAQKGQVVTVPIDGVGDVQFTSYGLTTGTQGTIDGTVTPQMVANSGSLNPDNGSPVVITTPPDDSNQQWQVVATANNIQSTATVDDFRTALRVQEWLEKNARSGTRPYEMLFSHFGVHSRDARLQRAEFIQGNLQVYSVGNVYTTTNSTSSTAIPGAKYSIVNSSGLSNQFKYKVQEHGYIMGILTVYPIAGYMNGIRRQFLELDRFDYVWPEFANLGEQPIHYAEVKMVDTMQNPDPNARSVKPLDTWAYNPRYSQYKTHPNEVHGDFLTSLDFFHDARDFSSIDPHFNKYFISMNPDYNNLNRIFNNTYMSSANHHCYIDCLHMTKAIRPLPYFDVPRIL